MKSYTILVVTRSESLAHQLQQQLNAERFVVRWAPSTKQACALLVEPSLQVLDLPQTGGARSLPRLQRRFGVPLVALVSSGRQAPDGIEWTLEHPFEARQLAERVHSILMAQMPHVIHAPHMSLDIGSRLLQIRGCLYQLRPTGARIMAMLMKRAGEVVHRNDLFHHVWETDDSDTTRALDVHIAHLRRQLEEDPREPKLIVTEWGRGYRLQPPGPRTG